MMSLLLPLLITHHIYYLTICRYVYASVGLITAATPAGRAVINHTCRAYSSGSYCLIKAAFNGSIFSEVTTKK